MAQFLHGKPVACSVYSKNLKHFEKRLLQNILFLRSSCSQKFIKEGLFKEFIKTHRETSVPELLASSLKLNWKKGPRHRCFPEFYEIFKNAFFIEALGVTASDSSSQAVYHDIIVKTLKYHNCSNIFDHIANFENAFCRLIWLREGNLE